MPNRRRSDAPGAGDQSDQGKRRFSLLATTREQEPGGIAHETGELHRLLVESVQDYAIFALDPEGYILSWNAGAQRFKGYTADEIIGKHFSIFYPQEKIATKFPEYELREAARTGRFEDEGWRLRKDGSRFWASVVITALRDKTGTLVGFAKVTRDLTERRALQERAIEDARRVAAEEAARVAAESSRERIERLQQLTAMLAAAHTIAEITKIVFSEGFRTFRVDAGALATIDLSGQFIRLIGDSGYEHLPNRFRHARRDASTPINTVLDTGQPLVFGSRAERDDRYPELAEPLAPYETTVIIPLGSRAGLIGALAMHWRAIGAPSEDMLAFMQSFAQQCGQALERAQLYEAELTARREAEEARARADEANRAKSEFLAAMSHELRTPLNAIGGYAELIDLGVRGPVTPEQHEDLRRIQRSQQHLLGIINDLLNFSRLDAGQIDYDFADVPLDEIFDTVVQMIVPQAASKSLQFESRACGPAVIVRVDRAKTEQILLNLLSNAVKFTESGGRVTLRCGRIGEREVMVEVADSGSGIAPDHLERIFEPFVQVGRSLTSTREGAGLGLAISRELARAMGGEISVTSTLGVGSTFMLQLPRSAP
jgi:PAS domain S-box-containing protein